MKKPEQHLMKIILILILQLCLSCHFGVSSSFMLFTSPEPPLSIAASSSSWPRTIIFGYSPPQHTNLLKSTQNTNMTLQVRRPGSHRQRPISNNWLLTWVAVCPSVCLANAFFLSETGRQDRNYANGSSKKDDWNKFWTLVPQMCRWFCDCRGSLSSSPFTDKRRSSTGVHCQLGPRKLT